MTIRRANVDDADELLQLYADTITSVNKKDYSKEQIQVWASTANRKDSLKKKIAEQFFYVAEDDAGTIIGFASLSSTGYFDMLYVHKGYQGKRVATTLWKKILSKATELKIKSIETDASITAKFFFEKQGFVLVKEQTVIINGIGLINYKMVFNNGTNV